ncbi:MAG: hypothetical protein AVDCRST_MAG45-722, partial [uncultured Solirubrobacterales bacterium]
CLKCSSNAKRSSVPSSPLASCCRMRSSQACSSPWSSTSSVPKRARCPSSAAAPSTSSCTTRATCSAFPAT